MHSQAQGSEEDLWKIVILKISNYDFVVNDFLNLSIFIDESGSTGSNFLDSHQPYFVQAGLVLRTDEVKKVENLFSQWEKRYLKSRQVEIKGNRLFRSAKGFVLFEELFEMILPHILSPTFAVLDKKFGLCFTAVEFFLDNGYNEAVNINDYYKHRVLWAEDFYKFLSPQTWTAVVELEAL